MSCATPINAMLLEDEREGKRDNSVTNLLRAISSHYPVLASATNKQPGITEIRSGIRTAYNKIEMICGADDDDGPVERAQGDLVPEIKGTKTEEIPHPFTISAMLANPFEGGRRAAARDDAKCAVCGDQSSGKHYGILACNGCSGFFKRSVRRKLIYRCQTRSGNCLVDKAHRNQCQACRLKKCLQTGMNKDAVQNERQPRSSSQILPEQVYDELFMPNGAISAHHPLVHMSMLPSAHQCGSSRAYNNVPIGLAVQRFINDSDEKKQQYCVRVLHGVIQWTRCVPLFTILPLTDQLRLLERSWAKLFIIAAVEYHLEQENAPFLELFDDDALERGLIEDVLNLFRQLAVDNTEYTYLKAIVLFNTGVCGVDQLISIEDHVLLMLSHLCRINKPHQPTRFGRLLLCVAGVSQISAKFLENSLFGSSSQSVTAMLAEAIRM